MEMMVFILTVVGVAGLGLLLLFPAFAHMDEYAVRVRAKKGGTKTAAEAPKESAILNICKLVGQTLLGMIPALADKRTNTLLQQANYRTPDHLAIFIGIKGIVVIGLVSLSLLSAAANGNPTSILLAIPSAFCGWLLPNFMLAGRVKQRQNQIFKELPTVIDLLIVCAQAGLGMLMCVDKVSKEVGDSCPVLGTELKQLLNDVKVFAKSVPHALFEMGERCGVEPLTSMASALIAAETKGSDISYPLKMQAAALRDKMKRKKEEEASKVPVKMVPVIMVFVMPLILCPMLGPAIITIMNAMGPMLGGGK